MCANDGYWALSNDEDLPIRPIHSSVSPTQSPLSCYPLSRFIVTARLSPFCAFVQTTHVALNPGGAGIGLTYRSRILFSVLVPMDSRGPWCDASLFVFSSLTTRPSTSPSLPVSGPSSMPYPPLSSHCSFFLSFLSRIIVHRGSSPHIAFYFLDMIFNVTKAPCGLNLSTPGVRMHHHSRV